MGNDPRQSLNYRNPNSASGQSTQSPGWYVDPSDDALLRWWDGDRWTESTTSNTEGTPSTARRQAYLDQSEEWGGSARSEDSLPPRSAPDGARRPRRISRRSDSDNQTSAAGPVVVRGAARAVQQRTIGSQAPMEILSFRLERYDSAYNRLAPVPVELGGGMQFSGNRISGQVSEGDEVEVHGTWGAGTLRAETVVNLSTGAHVQRRTGWQELSESITPEGGKKIRRGFLIVVAAIATVVIGAITGFVLLVNHAQSNFEQQRDDSTKNWCMDIRDNGMKPPHECDGVL
jgi:hypothetical protein